MSDHAFDPARTALMIVDMQNDFLHPDGAYARGGAKSAAIAALPARIAPVADAMRRAGGWIVSTHFTLVPGKDGEPFVSDHLRRMRPFLAKGDFAPGGWGHALIDELGAADLAVEKVAFSAFYMSRLDYVLNRAGIETLVFCGIVTNGGVESTLRDAHVRDYSTILLEDACAAFSDEVHRAAVGSMASISPVMSCRDFVARLERRGGTST